MIRSLLDFFYCFEENLVRTHMKYFNRSFIIGHGDLKKMIPNHWQDSTQSNCSVIKVLINLFFMLYVIIYRLYSSTNKKHACTKECSSFFASPNTSMFIFFFWFQKQSCTFRQPKTNSL